MLRSLRIRASRAAESVEPASPKSRSKTARGLFSPDSGVVSLRQEIVFVYVQLKPTSHDPETSRLSSAISREASCVCCSKLRAMS